jgi:hypothetical protein
MIYPEKEWIMLSIIKTIFISRRQHAVADLERAYLNASVSRIDLERRQREVELGLFRRSTFDM